MTEPTISSRLSAAAICRANGWTPGTRLVGDEGYGPTVIEITAVGERDILAKTLSHNGIARDGREGAWVLFCRAWHVVADDDPAAVIERLTARVAELEAWIGNAP